MFIIATVGVTCVQISSRLKKPSIRMKSLISAVWQSRTSLAAWKNLGIRIQPLQGNQEGQTKRRTPTPAKIAFAGENTCEKDISE
jgi:hypothetical protein